MADNLKVYQVNDKFKMRRNLVDVMDAEEFLRNLGRMKAQREVLKEQLDLIEKDISSMEKLSET